MEIQDWHWLFPVSALLLQIALIWHGVILDALVVSAGLLACVVAALWYTIGPKLLELHSAAIATNTNLAVVLGPLADRLIHTGLILTFAMLIWGGAGLYSVVRRLGPTN